MQRSNTKPNRRTVRHIRLAVPEAQAEAIARDVAAILRLRCGSFTLSTGDDARVIAEALDCIAPAAAVYEAPAVG